MRGGSVRVDAFAKLTLSLRVTGVREGGFHAIEALAVSLTEPHDSLELTSANSGGIVTTVDGDEAGGVPAGEANLVERAARLVLRDGAARIHLHKRIPAGGGLGGGSADAAATLVALASLAGGVADDEELHRLAAELGSDVPFCLRGGAAWMRGRGEILEPVALPAINLLVATPPFALATGEVYRAWDELGGPCATRYVQPPGELAQVLDALVNDLEPAAERLEPRLRGFREALEVATCRPALLAGSGSSVAVVFELREEAEEALERVEREMGCRAWLGTGAPAGVALT